MTTTEQITRHYMQFVTSTEKMSDTRTRYHVGDRFTIDVTRCPADLSNPYSLMNIWKKHGFIAAVLPSYLVVDTYYTDVKGNCWGYYNVTHKKSEDGHRMVIDFNYLREATPENERELVARCIRLSEMDIR